MTKVYSPSSTLNFQRCPQLWHWRRQGWQSQTIGNPDLAAAVGIGISKGLESYYKGGTEHEAVDVGCETARAVIDTRLDAGATLLSSVHRTHELIPKRVTKALKGFFNVQPFPSDWHSFRPELVFPDHGGARADLLFQSELGPGILDFKSKVTCQEYIRDNFWFDAETSWQLLHYVWAAREMGITVNNTAICLIVIEPLDITVEQWVVNEEALARWVLDARRWWQLMELVELGQVHPLRVGDHRDKYGLCSYYGLCYGDNRSGQYVQVERVR